MRVLFLTQILPYPPDAGPKIKTYHVLRYLAEYGHHLTLVSFVRKAEEPYLASLQPFCAQIHAVPMQRSYMADARAWVRSCVTQRPFLVTRDFKSEMDALVQRLAQENHFDVIHADQLTMGQFALSVNGPRRVLDAHNAVWTIVERARQTAPLITRPFLTMEARRLKAYEGRLCAQMDAVLAVSEIDRQALVNAGADANKITVIPIALDCAQVQPIDRAETSQEILIVSTLFYPPNADGVRWFLREVYPRVRQMIPDSTLTIVGPRPPRDITQCAMRNAQCAISVTGYVPDLQPYLERAAVMVVPVRAASGMRVRILEALARGIPVVTTTTGVEGIDAVHEQHLLIADEPPAFAAEVVRLLQDAALRRRLAENGRRLVEAKYDWRVVLPKLEAVYRSLL